MKKEKNRGVSVSWWPITCDGYTRYSSVVDYIM